MKTKEELNDLRSKKINELSLLLKKEYETLRKLKLELKMRELKNVNKIKKSRKRIARIMTILREKIEESAKSEKPDQGEKR